MKFTGRRDGIPRTTVHVPVHFSGADMASALACWLADEGTTETGDITRGVLERIVRAHAAKYGQQGWEASGQWENIPERYYQAAEARVAELHPESIHERSR